MSDHDSIIVFIGGIGCIITVFVVITGASIEKKLDAIHKDINKKVPK